MVERKLDFHTTRFAKKNDFTTWKKYPIYKFLIIAQKGNLPCLMDLGRMNLWIISIYKSWPEVDVLYEKD